MTETVNVVGARFGRLVLVSLLPCAGGRHRIALCRCDCGREKQTRFSTLVAGHCRSCGCLRVDAAREKGRRSASHGEAGLEWTPEYQAWANVIKRCTNPGVQHYRYYGGRGITVCARWRESYPAFLADMGRRPSPKHSIDRINNDGNYEPGNCRWATKSEQRRNQRSRAAK